MKTVFSYDTERYPFRQWAQSVLDWEDLEHLHDHPCDGATKPGYRVYRFINRFKEAYETGMRTQFAAFVAEYAQPHLDYVAWSTIFPNFRVHETGQETTSYMHRDRDYVPDRVGMKIWLPFTRVEETSTLWVESAEGEGDLAPVNLDYGEALFFDSLNLLHGCYANQTGLTRVSVDFLLREDPVLAARRNAQAETVR